ncbi:IS200/IS605 family transposase [Lentilactobacillus kisonensis]|uniref:Transposase-like protein n=1 Tax=Lentilactobacillus kisonensis F0435 TaxID=797516 RepID=H1LKC2_9LACO|nr:IS200/IS605 family transposase [Lentilactobacillus kisonensis]EHO47596.1 transposase-like protein [Lentilactobacillus kisonensis F0435]
MSNKKQPLAEAIYERNYVYNFHFHLIWVTKHRYPAFTNSQLVTDMEVILQHIADLNEVTVERMAVMPDHVHLLISFKPKYAPTNVVKAFKGGSARLFFEKHPEIKAQKFWGGHLWSHSYYMSTLGKMSKEIVDHYIDDQRNQR